MIFTRKFWNNKPLLAAFAVGTLLLVAVLAIPVLEELMQAVALPWTLGLAIPGLAIIKHAGHPAAQGHPHRIRPETVTHPSHHKGVRPTGLTPFLRPRRRALPSVDAGGRNLGWDAVGHRTVVVDAQAVPT